MQCAPADTQFFCGLEELPGFRRGECNALAEAVDGIHQSGRGQLIEPRSADLVHKALTLRG